jgi:hypothetical protein
MTMCKFLIAAALLLPVSAQAASITVGQNGLFASSKSIFVRGEILPGDAQTFAQVTRELPPATAVFLSGPGGDGPTAIAIGKMVRARGFWTVVDRRAGCASACAIIWLAGVHVLAQRNSYIGFHRASDMNGAECLNCDLHVANYLHELGYNDAQIAYTMRASPAGTPPATMEWHARYLGIHFQIVSSLFGAWRSTCSEHFCVGVP